jgi:hypothetical protein
MPFLSERDLNVLRGKTLVGHTSTDEILSIFEHIDELEMKLDEFDEQDGFGTEGWRHFFGIPE